MFGFYSRSFASMTLASLVCKARCLEGLSLQDLLLFIDICRMTRPFLEFKTTDLTVPPAILPHEVATFVHRALTSLGEMPVQLLWEAMKHEVWANTKGTDGTQGIDEALATRYNLHCQSHGFKTCTWAFVCLFLKVNTSL
jgi:hypothetical protein